MTADETIKANSRALYVLLVSYATAEEEGTQVGVATKTLWKALQELIACAQINDQEGK